MLETMVCIPQAVLFSPSTSSWYFFFSMQDMQRPFHLGAGPPRGISHVHALTLALAVVFLSLLLPLGNGD